MPVGGGRISFPAEGSAIAHRARAPRGEIKGPILRCRTGPVLPLGPASTAASTLAGTWVLERPRVEQFKLYSRTFCRNPYAPHVTRESLLTASCDIACSIALPRRLFQHYDIINARNYSTWPLRRTGVRERDMDCRTTLACSTA